MGRKKATNPKVFIKSIRWSLEEWEQVKRLSKAMDMTPSKLIRSFVLPRIVK